MSYKETIISDLHQAFAIEHIALKNESFMHNVPADSESHFKLIIVSDDFLGITKVKRHQGIYNALSETMKSIHALSIQAFTVAEFNLDPMILDSPDCSNK
ncbi:MAG: transcriptional regulator BolA [SAR86 cluster bacterium BACL1 MAG-121001-bin56]|jgi:stress-induced morphogen|nr:MAG: transcriptional regulator BolA [SAR86 cluster bacterium BACL1 MAG-121004-bin11]KRP15309.1 MAG: transcriptional regulator BolA [SAR86 cluster bacterium BACL1 MAG-121001-bin56]|tara:strand:+ start:563 stop:862 length:300 start_codon:yes stop_codon:yes gene_type:complete